MPKLQNQKLFEQIFKCTVKFIFGTLFYDF